MILRGRPLPPGPVAMVAALAVAALFTACDPQRIEKLEEGVATEADVRKQFGNPAAVSTRPDGSKVLEYPRQPEGWTNYVIVIGPDGKMSSLRQLLTPASFAKVQPGQDKLAVMDTLGKAAKTAHYALKNEEVWDWRYKDGTINKVFSVTFNGQGRVVSTATMDDPRDSTSGGR